MRKIVIVGNSAAAEILYGYLKQDPRYKVVSFCADAEFITSPEFHGLEVLPLEELSKKVPPGQATILLGVGYSGLGHVRSELYRRIKSMGYQVETYIHPTATLLNDAQIGEGSVVLASSVVEPFVEIGRNAFIWCNCTVAHHARIGNDAWIASNTVISGQAMVGDRSFIGVGAVVSNKVRIAEDNVIGGGAFKTRDTQPNEVWLSRSAEKHRIDATNYAKHYLV